MEKLQYPIGRFQAKNRPLGRDEVKSCINSISTLVPRIKTAIELFTPEKWQKNYRIGGWAKHQLVHHLADVHINLFIRFKIGITEDRPIIKTFDENAWIDTPDVLEANPITSIQILEGLNTRWVILLDNLDEKDLNREVVLIDNNKVIKLYEILEYAAWHCEHHLAHLSL